MSLASRAAPNAASASAPRLASLSTRIGTSSRLRIAATAGTPTQPGQDRARADDAVLLPDRPGQPHPGADHLAGVDARFGEQLDHEVGRRVEPFLGGVVGVERHRPLGQDARAEVRDRDAQVAVAEVDADGGAGRRVEREKDRRPAALGPVRLAELRALDHEAVGLQVGDEARDGRAAEPGPAGDLGARDQPLVAERVDHTQPVQAAQRFERAGSTRGHGAGIRPYGRSFVKASNEPSGSWSFGMASFVGWPNKPLQSRRGPPFRAPGRPSELRRR